MICVAVLRRRFPHLRPFGFLFLRKGGGAGGASEVAEQLVLLIPVHLRRLLLLFGVDLHLDLGRRRAQAHLGERVVQRAALVVRQLQGKISAGCYYLSVFKLFWPGGSCARTCVLLPLMVERVDRVERVVELPFIWVLMEPLRIGGPS